MPESLGEQQQRRRQLCGAETFLYCLGVEIERYARYDRAFTIVLIQPPASGDKLERFEVTRAASERALGLLRSCDVITIFESSAFVIALLPETGAAGARTVFDRFDEQMVQPGAGWTLKMATYPKHATSIDYFLERFTELLKNSDAETEPAGSVKKKPVDSVNTKPVDRYRYLRQATTDVSRS